MRKKLSKDTTTIKISGKKRAQSTQKKISKCSLTLTIIQGSDIDFGKTYNLSEDSVLIGRDKSNSIPLDDTSVSKVHCEIRTVRTNEREQIIIEDLDSTNGTYLNGRLIRRQVLQLNDRIAVGETVFRFNCSDEIEEEYQSKLFSFATTDSLTGFYNRRYILNELENQYKIAKRNYRIFSLVIIDIDNFKRINDTYGHAAGDEFLKNTAYIIKHTLREQDISGRVGGDEFLVVLPETDLDGAFNLANRVRLRIEETEIIFRSGIIKTTISAGISQYGPDIPNKSSGAKKNMNPSVLFHAADQALYEAKKLGRNRVVKAKDYK